MANFHKAKKRFGQNFLKDESIKAQIIQAMPAYAANMQVVEIGPGLGDLTEKLLAANYRVKSLEIDSDLLEILREKFAAELAANRWQLEHIDALDWRSDEQYFIAANLPYNVSAPLILRALCDERCSGLLVMVQEEMAARVLAEDMGPLGVLALAQCECERICAVPPSAFEPAPKVQSAVIRLTRKADALPDADAKDFAAFVRRMFASPRKVLKASVKSDAKLLAICDEMGLCSLRAAQISVKSFLEIYKRMKHERKQNCTQL